MAVALTNPEDNNNPDRFDNYLDELFGYPFQSDDELTPEQLEGRDWNDLTPEEQANVHINPDDQRY